MKNYYKIISTHLQKFVGAIQRNQTSGIRDFGACSNISVVETESPQVLEPLDELLLESAARRSNPLYSPLGDSHELIKPAGSHLLSQSRDYIVYTPHGYN